MVDRGYRTDLAVGLGGYGIAGVIVVISAVTGFNGYLAPGLIAFLSTVLVVPKP